MTAVRVRHGSVVFADFRPARRGCGPDGSNPPAAVPPRTAAGALPARWSPRPLRAAARHFARTETAVQLREYGWLVGLLLAAVVCMAGGDHLHALANGGH